MTTCSLHVVVILKFSIRVDQIYVATMLSNFQLSTSKLSQHTMLNRL